MTHKSGLHSVALCVTGVRANGYKNGYTFENALGRGGGECATGCWRGHNRSGTKFEEGARRVA